MAKNEVLAATTSEDINAIIVTNIVLKKKTRKIRKISF